MMWRLANALHTIELRQQRTEVGRLHFGADGRDETKNISIIHVVLCLQEEGVMLRVASRNGTSVQSGGGGFESLDTGDERLLHAGDRISLLLGMACALILSRRCLSGASKPTDLPDGAYWFVVGGWEVIVIVPYQSIPGIRDAWEKELAGLRVDAAPLTSTDTAVRVDMADLTLPAFDADAYYAGRVAEAEAIPGHW